jgi:hypothetical protein
MFKETGSATFAAMAAFTTRNRAEPLHAPLGSRSGLGKQIVLQTGEIAMSLV